MGRGRTPCLPCTADAAGHPGAQAQVDVDDLRRKIDSRLGELPAFLS
jgi:hypothetical protein